MYNTLPSRFDFSQYSVGRFGHSIRVFLEDGTLKVERRYPGDIEPSLHIVQVTGEEWVSFINALDLHDVWKWKASYTDRLTFDGTAWRLCIQVGDRDLTSSGHNDYPGQPDKFRGPLPINWPLYTGFCKAVEQLIKEKLFP